MKILIINERLIEGGAEQSCLKMKKLLEPYHNVTYLTFDNKFDTKIKEVENPKNIVNIKTSYKLINKIIFNPILYFKIRKLLKKIQPDKIILNNTFCSPITQLKALKGYEVYQIVRDYSIVCPKMTAVKNDYSICYGYKNADCAKECVYHNSKIQLLIKLDLTRKLEKIRKNIVKKFIAPSENLNKYLLKYNYNSCCINNPMDISKQELQKDMFGNELKQYIYLGMVNENKGIYRVLDVYQEFSKDKAVNLKIIGKCTTDEDEKKLESYLKKNNKITYLGYKTHNQVIEELKDANFIIVPSLWIENYPTTALEGMLYKCIVIGSDRGGIPEIIGDNRGFLFDILDTNSILENLLLTYNLTKEEYKKRIEKSYRYIVENNSFEQYYKKIVEVIKD